MQNRQLSMLTYNVWVDNDDHPENQSGLINYFINSSADIICLQEVTRHFFAIIQATDQLRNTYDYQAPRMIDESPCGGLLMIKKKHQAKFYQQRELHKSRSCRYLDYASFTFHNVQIAVASIHLDSVFFTKERTDFKVTQLERVCAKLSELKPDCMLIGGDMNFTGGDQLKYENAAIQKLQLTDIWKQLRPNITEDESDLDFRKNDITWDSANNPNIEFADDFHRPDRLFMRLFKPAVEATQIERVTENFSDHYGVKATFALTE